MNRPTLPVLMAGLVLLAAACSGGTEIDAKKAELKEKKKELQDLRAQISELEKEIAEADPAFGQEVREAQLVTVLPVKQETFEHFVEVSGDVRSDKNVTISAEAMGVVERVLVTEGQQVRRGQSLMSINADVLRNNISELKSQLELATAVYERQKNLWDQKIGTEVQFLQTKANKEALENRLSMLLSQLAQANVTAPFAGTIEEVLIRAGEAASPGMPMLRLVSLQDMSIRADVSERFVGSFKQGDAVEVYFPSLDKTITSTIKAVGQVINPNNRTFTLEARLPNDSELLRPNLLAVLRVKDFEQEGALVVPTHLIQRDRKGDFVYVVEDRDNAKQVTKKHIETGLSYQNETMIKSGLQPSDVLVNEGFRQVSEGVNVKVATETVATAN
ncbi:efflux RND transporter periplasmic adaptor subunit [Cesiribacter andamanensis]|uniref:Cation efflux system protein CzcB n=1 Tax=Cesiribacter andamanensis AMV16 TaxID=1279009 RepID=M7NM07_9BACT|nr:efflux RND transporter periplasmic adaptor subunit [Cesiribacter andamanensis]EMR02790.1 Cation efflux system protein CzcB [Cesiribacter andamanensis AMV16]